MGDKVLLPSEMQSRTCVCAELLLTFDHVHNHVTLCCTNTRVSGAVSVSVS